MMIQWTLKFGGYEHQPVIPSISSPPPNLGHLQIRFYDFWSNTTFTDAAWPLVVEQARMMHILGEDHCIYDRPVVVIWMLVMHSIYAPE